jgi:hypothetical protein
LRIENGEWRIENGELRMENGELRMENEEWEKRLAFCLSRKTFAGRWRANF